VWVGCGEPVQIGVNKGTMVFDQAECGAFDRGGIDAQGFGETFYEGGFPCAELSVKQAVSHIRVFAVEVGGEGLGFLRVLGLFYH